MVMLYLFGGSSFLRRVRDNDPSLTEMVLEKYCIDEQQANALLTNAMPYNTSWDISHLEMDIGVWRAFAGSLRRNSNIICLDLSKRAIGVDAMTAVGGALCDDTTIKQLKLDGCCLRSDGAKVVASFILRNRTVTKISLSGNKMGSAGAKVVADALCDNTTVESLDLSKNLIGAKGFKALAGALRQNDTLKKLDLSRNNLEVRGATSLAESLHSNSVVALRLSDPWSGTVPEDTARLFAEAILQNPSRAQLDLRNVARIGDLIASTEFGQDPSALLESLSGINLATDERGWSLLFQALYKAGMQGVIRRAHLVQNDSVLPSTLGKVGAKIGLGGVFEFIRSKPNLGL